MSEQQSKDAPLFAEGAANPVGEIGVTLAMPNVSEGPQLTLYGLRSTFQGETAYSFEQIAIENHPGVAVDNGRFYPNELSDPIQVAIPEGSRVVGTDLEWTFGQQTKRSSANQVLAMAMTGVQGFRILE